MFLALARTVMRAPVWTHSEIEDQEIDRLKLVSKSGLRWDIRKRLVEEDDGGLIGYGGVIS